MFKIGNVEIKGKMIAAPMAGVTNKVFRKIVEELGADLTYTEMTSNVGLKYNSEKTLKYADIDLNAGPTALQIFGGEVQDYIDAAIYYDKNSNADIIDINMGCPVPKVAIKSKAGSSLLKTPDVIGEIIKGITSSISKPLTIKMRLGWDENSKTYLEVAKIAEANGVAAIAIHGRTKQEMYKGKANWDAIKEIKKTVSIPVIGNGDVDSPEKVKDMLDYTGCDAVMVARSLRENPWFFIQAKEFLDKGEITTKPSIDDVVKLMNRYIDDMFVEYENENYVIGQARAMASHWFIPFKGIKKEKQALLTIKTIEGFKEQLNVIADKAQA